MRVSIPAFQRVAIVNVLHKLAVSLRYVDTLWGRSALTVIGWFVIAVSPLVAFDAGGGQTAVDIIRYVVFRGLDRDAWWAASALSMFSGVLSASAILVSLVIHTIGCMFRDRALVLWSSGVTLVALVVMVVASEPVAAFSMFNSAALPHIGWWLTLIYITLMFGIARGWTFEPDPRTN